MNYATHSLRTNLQEYKSRLYRAPYSQFGNQLKYLMSFFDEEISVAGILTELTIKYPLSPAEYKELFKKINNGEKVYFDNNNEQAALSFQFLQQFIQEFKSYDLHSYITFQKKGFDETKEKIIENYISPIIYVLHDTLNKSNSVIYLLEKYKKRTEWFTKGDLYKRYTTADRNFEQIFEDDLRLFLFDQGIDYPFSTPHSPSGRADVIGQIDTEDPLVIEIKIFDRNKGYGKDRIKSGFAQIIKYANDYNKNVGYLVIYNMDNAELNMEFSESKSVFPPTIAFNNKVFYFIVVNVAIQAAASKIGTIESVTITESELLRSSE
jgi:hypothetical protein